MIQRMILSPILAAAEVREEAQFESAGAWDWGISGCGMGAWMIPVMATFGCPAGLVSI